ncbi:M81 family metallopeptidase [Rhodobacteraceae bacterium B1Z28]|uniref:Microcystinase C n=1 Tax=Ruegeria haliotis TaxID=2747601 RepID=A0ABX2PRF8_9RHOB|nr:M81 family metallopeptidase [Ruegeria haliotis]NVO56598.1 M81 family metallopeptidase [Ruegeria haliotis]
MANKRIAIAGFQHETNCYGATKAGLIEFEMADSWPGMLISAQVISETEGMNLPVAGFTEAAKATGFEVVPILWCSAEPSAQVSDHAFETICGMLLDGICKAGQIDGIYLDLHGAMVTEAFADGEGEILRRVREIVGPDVPVVASLDLHANVSAQMVEHADYLSIFRSYPHLDMAETGARCVPVLQRLLAGETLHKVFRTMPYLIPLHAQHTGSAPFNEIYQLPVRFERQKILAEIALGFTAADFPDTGPSCVAYAARAQQATVAVEEIVNLFVAREADIDCSMLSLEEAVLISRQSREKPVVLADVQDNAGAGGTSDTTGLLAVLIESGAKSVLMGLFHDPESAKEAHVAGEGALVKLAIGAKSNLAGHVPVNAEFEVLALGDGACRYTGEMYGGGVATLGKTAALRLVGHEAEVDLVLTSIRNQCLDRAHFTHIGLNPKNYSVICVKSTTHFRADFEPIAGEVFAVSSPGAFLCDLEKIPYTCITRRLPKTRETVFDTSKADSKKKILIL